MDAVPESAYRRALHVLERIGDTELFEAYGQYVSRLEATLTPQEQQVYTSFQQRTMGGVLPEEQAIADKVAASADVLQLYDRYLTLLNSRHTDGSHAS